MRVLCRYIGLNTRFCGSTRIYAVIVATVVTAQSLYKIQHFWIGLDGILDLKSSHQQLQTSRVLSELETSLFIWSPTTHSTHPGFLTSSLRTPLLPSLILSNSILGLAVKGVRSSTPGSWAAAMLSLRSLRRLSSGGVPFTWRRG